MCEYNDLYAQSDTLLLANFFDNFQNMCIEICELDPAHFLPKLRLAWKAALKKTKSILDLLTDIHMLLMVEKSIREEYVMLLINMWNPILNAWKIMIKKNKITMS